MSLTWERLKEGAGEGFCKEEWLVIHHGQVAPETTAQQKKLNGRLVYNRLP